MEVHHHGHVHHKKKWKEYFFQFLMLFLAVFCGFLAEYQLEHKIEKDREKQFMKSLLEDLHKDTTEIQRTYNFGIRQKLLGDSLVEVLNKNDLLSNNISTLYLLNTNTSRVVRVSFETRTSSQLKNAGGMRLVHNKTAVDSILNYWTHIDVCNFINDRLQNIGESRQEVGRKIFHNKYYPDTDAVLAPVFEIKPGVRLISDDPALLSEYSNIIYSKNKVLANFFNQLINAKTAAVGLMDVIRKKYHLK